jgi:protein kinase-like protein
MSPDRTDTVLSGRYVLGERLASHEKLDIYSGEERETRRAVMVVFFRVEGADDRAILELERRAGALSRLVHPGVSRVFCFGVEGGRPYIVTEPSDDETLFEVLSRGELRTDRAIRIMSQLLDAVEAIHTAGVVHGALVASSIELKSDGTPRITDLAVRHLLGALRGAPASHDPASDFAALDRIARAMMENARSDVAVESSSPAMAISDGAILSESAIIPEDAGARDSSIGAARALADALENAIAAAQSNTADSAIVRIEEVRVGGELPPITGALNVGAAAELVEAKTSADLCFAQAAASAAALQQVTAPIAIAPAPSSDVAEAKPPVFAPAPIAIVEAPRAIARAASKPRLRAQPAPRATSSFSGEIELSRNLVRRAKKRFASSIIEPTAPDAIDEFLPVYAAWTQKLVRAAMKTPLGPYVTRFIEWIRPWLEEDEEGLDPFLFDREGSLPPASDWNGVLRAMDTGPTGYAPLPASPKPEPARIAAPAAERPAPSIAAPATPPPAIRAPATPIPAIAVAAPAISPPPMPAAASSTAPIPAPASSTAPIPAPARATAAIPAPASSPPPSPAPAFSPHASSPPPIPARATAAIPAPASSPPPIPARAIPARAIPAPARSPAPVAAPARSNPAVSAPAAPARAIAAQQAPRPAAADAVLAMHAARARAVQSAPADRAARAVRPTTSEAPVLRRTVAKAPSQSLTDLDDDLALIRPRYNPFARGWMKSMFSGPPRGSDGAGARTIYLAATCAAAVIGLFTIMSLASPSKDAAQVKLHASSVSAAGISDSTFTRGESERNPPARAETRAETRAQPSRPAPAVRSAVPIRAAKETARGKHRRRR